MSPLHPWASQPPVIQPKTHMHIINYLVAAHNCLIQRPPKFPSKGAHPPCWLNTDMVHRWNPTQWLKTPNFTESTSQPLLQGSPGWGIETSESVTHWGSRMYKPQCLWLVLTSLCKSTKAIKNCLLMKEEYIPLALRECAEHSGSFRKQRPLLSSHHLQGPRCLLYSRTPLCRFTQVQVWQLNYAML